MKSPSTKLVYTYALNEFMRFSKIKEYDDMTKFSTNKIQKLLENWVMHLKGKNLKASSITTKLNGVELFLDMNKVVFHKRILHRLLPSDDYVLGGEVPFTTEEIQLMLASTTKLRSKALINFLACTGVRPSSITDPVLRLKHVEEMPHGCKSVKVYDGSKEWYYAFLTPEASKSLDQYINSRKSNGESLTPESPVFPNVNENINGKKNDYMSARSVRQLMYNILRMSGIERTKTGNRFDKAAVYGFRKRFATILKINNAVNSNIAEKLMAHKRGLDGSYLKPTREECFTEFLKAIPELTISDESRDKLKISNLEQQTISIEELKSFVLDMEKSIVEETRKQVREQINKQAEEIKALTHYLIKDVLRRSPDTGDALPESYTSDIKLTSHGYPKPSEISEEKLEYFMKSSPKLAETVIQIAETSRS